MAYVYTTATRPAQTEAMILRHDVFSNSAFPSLTVAYCTLVPPESADANGVFGAASAISLISSLIFLVTASCTAPGGLAAISSTSLSVSTSLTREARDWRSMVVGPSNRRKSCKKVSRQPKSGGVGNEFLAY